MQRSEIRGHDNQNPRIPARGLHPGYVRETETQRTPYVIRT